MPQPKTTKQPRGIYRRAGRNLIEVYVEDDDDMEAIKALIEAGTFKSGAEFGRVAFREFLRSHDHQRVYDEDTWTRKTIRKEA